MNPSPKALQIFQTAVKTTVDTASEPFYAVSKVLGNDNLAGLVMLESMIALQTHAEIALCIFARTKVDPRTQSHEDSLAMRRLAALIIYRRQIELPQDESWYDTFVWANSEYTLRFGSISTLGEILLSRCDNLERN